PQRRPEHYDMTASKRYQTSTFNDNALAGLVRYCSMLSRYDDGSSISFNDRAEIIRMRDEFMKNRLGLTNPDAELDAAIAKIASVMDASHATNRVTAYYLLAERFGKLSLFA